MGSMPIKKTLQNDDNALIKWCHRIAVIWLVLLIGGCSQQQPGASIDILRVGILPDQEKAAIEKKYSLLFNYITEEIKIPHKIIYVSSYQELLNQFHEKKIDLALFGGVTFIKANQQDGAVPLVLRDVDNQFSSIILVSSNHPAKTLNDLKGASFSFGSRLSTSGHYMPRHFLNNQGIHAEEFFSEIKYSGAHDKTAFWVRDGIVDAGASSSGIIREMFRNGTLSPNETRILWETPPFSDYVWATQKNSSTHIRNLLQDAFLKLTTSNHEHKHILAAVGANYYLPASLDDFSSLIKTINNTTLDQTGSTDAS